MEKQLSLGVAPSCSCTASTEALAQLGLNGGEMHARSAAQAAVRPSPWPEGDAVPGMVSQEASARVIGVIGN
jgi:hypothetical protein